MARSNANGLASPSLRKKPSSKKEPQKPQLIKPLGCGISEPKAVKGMQYNPLLFRWEGNENALAPFDTPASSSGAGSPNRNRDAAGLGLGLGCHSPKHSTVGQPALITNVGQVATGVQVVGGMVFDPKRMCWLKMAPSQVQGPGSGTHSQNGGSTPGLRGGAVGVSSVQLEEEEDVFAGLEDLKEEDEFMSGSFRGGGGSHGATASRNGRKVSDGEGKDGSGSGDEGWLASEEFDVGPEFVKRQRSEEEKWKRKVEKWLRPEMSVEDRGRDSWRWAIRDVVSSLQSAL